MASTFSTNLNLELMAKGENANAWGTITNDNLSAVDAEFALKGAGDPSQTQGIGQHKVYQGQQYYSTTERTLYICASGTSTASAGYYKLNKIAGINATAASADVIHVTGGDAQAGHVSISGGLNVTGALSAQSFAVNSATFSAIHVLDTACVSMLFANEGHFGTVSTDVLRVVGSASINTLHVSATACLDGPLFVSGNSQFGRVSVGVS